MQIFFFILIIVTYIIALFYSVNLNSNTLYFFLFMVMFQNIIVIMVCKYIPPSYNVLFSVIKEVMLYISLFICYIKNKKIHLIRYDKVSIICLLIYCIMLIKNMIFTSASIKSTILSLRFMILPILCIYVGKHANINKEQYNYLLKNITYFSGIIALLGIVELVFLGDIFWTNIGYTEYAEKMKGNVISDFINGVTVNFYTWDFGGIPIRRIVSITADPLATAFLVFLGAVIIFINKRVIGEGRINIKFDNILFFLLIVTAFLSLSKAVFVLAVVTALVCAYFFGWVKKSLLKIYIFTIGIMAIFILYFYVNNVGRVTSSLNHIMGLINGITSANLLGNGLGTAGSSVIMLTGAESDIAESYIGALFAQTGFIGGIAFILFMTFQAKNLIRLFEVYKDKKIIISIVCLVGVIICAFLSDSAISIMGTGMYFIISGISQKDELYQDEIIEKGRLA